jgi:magnesium-transporting ATPase (P-type)
MTDSPLRMGVGAFFANAWLWGGVALMVALQLLFTYAPLMNRLFATAPIGLADWGRVVAVGLAVFAVIEGEKALRRRGGKAI